MRAGTLATGGIAVGMVVTAAIGGVVAVGGYRSAFLAAAALALVGMALLRSVIDARVRQPVDPRAAELALENLEPDPP